MAFLREARGGRRRITIQQMRFHRPSPGFRRPTPLQIARFRPHPPRFAAPSARYVRNHCLPSIPRSATKRSSASIRGSSLTPLRMVCRRSFIGCWSRNPPHRQRTLCFLGPGLGDEAPGSGGLRDALNGILDQALRYQFPAHPEFDDALKVSKTNVDKVLEVVADAASTKEPGIVVPDQGLRKLTRQMAHPLKVGRMAVAGVHISHSCMCYDPWAPRPHDHFQSDVLGLTLTENAPPSSAPSSNPAAPTASIPSPGCGTSSPGCLPAPPAGSTNSPPPPAPRPPAQPRVRPPPEQPAAVLSNTTVPCAPLTLVRGASI
ncbi:MAG: phage resistance protein [Verrucomicrobiales bacterium]|nr:phage resistance protein [Verrucomicrobiales bacterium]